MVRISTCQIGSRFNELSIELTHKCTLKCIYCSSDSDLNKNIFLDLLKIVETIKNVKKEFKINTISLSGGETFLYPKFEELFKFLVKQELQILIYTSGVTIDKNNNRKSLGENILNQLSKYKENVSVMMNIQGHNKNIIETINGVSNSYEIITDSTNKLLEIDIPIEANVVPFKFNYEYLEKITNFCIEH
ncbi:hypothetical protein LCGC14_1872370, partial [marine sediment metagenome]